MYTLDINVALYSRLRAVTHLLLSPTVSISISIDVINVDVRGVLVYLKATGDKESPVTGPTIANLLPTLFHQNEKQIIQSFLFI